MDTNGRKNGWMGKCKCKCECECVGMREKAHKCMFLMTYYCLRKLRAIPNISLNEALSHRFLAIIIAFNIGKLNFHSNFHTQIENLYVVNIHVLRKEKKKQITQRRRRRNKKLFSRVDCHLNKPILHIHAHCTHT